MSYAAKWQTGVWSIVKKAVGTAFVLSAALIFVGLCCVPRLDLALGLVGWENRLSGRPNFVRSSSAGRLGVLAGNERGMVFWPADVEAGPYPALDDACVFDVLLSPFPFGDFLVDGVVLRLTLSPRQARPDCPTIADPDEHWSEMHELAATSLLRHVRERPGWGLADNSAVSLERMLRARRNEDIVFFRGPEVVLVPVALALVIVGGLMFVSPKGIVRFLRGGRASALMA